MHGIVYAEGTPRVPDLFPCRDLNKSSRFQRVMSQIKENKFLIKFRVFTLIKLI